MAKFFRIDSCLNSDGFDPGADVVVRGKPAAEVISKPPIRRAVVKA